MKPIDQRKLLRDMFDAAIEAAQPARCVPRHLAAAPKGQARPAPPTLLSRLEMTGNESTSC